MNNDFSFYGNAIRVFYIRHTDVICYFQVLHLCAKITQVFKKMSIIVVFLCTALNTADNIAL